MFFEETGGAREGFVAGWEGGRVVVGCRVEEVSEAVVCLADAQVDGGGGHCWCVHSCCVGVSR